MSRSCGAAQEGIQQWSSQHNHSLLQTPSTCQTRSSTQRKHTLHPLELLVYPPVTTQYLSPKRQSLLYWACRNLVSVARWGWGHIHGEEEDPHLNPNGELRHFISPQFKARPTDWETSGGGGQRERLESFWPEVNLNAKMKPLWCSWVQIHSHSLSDWQADAEWDVQRYTQTTDYRLKEKQWSTW